MHKIIKTLAVFLGILLCFNLKSCHRSHITDISTLIHTPIKSIETPTTVEQLQHIIQSTQEPLSIAGTRASQGGHIAYPHGIVIDTKKLNNVIAFDPEKKRITVQAGATWLDVQKYIDPYNLSVKVMQSYNDFTVGGSLSVNVHGRDIHYGQLIETVEEITVLTADGTFIKASRNNNKELFYAAIGGYGLLGIIVDATLSLTDNIKLKRNTIAMHIDDYPTFFMNTILNDPNATLHNANLYPNELTRVTSITWYKTDDEPTNNTRIYQYNPTNIREKFHDQLLRRISLLKKVRPSLEYSRLFNKNVLWRNYEMSSTIQAIEPFTRTISTSILQEYFIPLHNFIPFINKLRATVKEHTINLINASIRYVPKNSESLLTYAPQDSFAIVLYINIFNIGLSIKKAERWTQEIIDSALSCQGTYYLPYQLWATKEQLLQAYPAFNHFIHIKNQYDPHHRFLNNFFAHYAQT